jgi:hypothetical protein
MARKLEPAVVATVLTRVDSAASTEPCATGSVEQGPR